MRVLSHFSLVQFFVTLWTAAHQAPVYGVLQAKILKWVLFSSPGDLRDPGVEPMSLMSPAMAGGFCTTSAIWEAHSLYIGLL